jgi:hypothetical protein
MAAMGLKRERGEIRDYAMGSDVRFGSKADIARDQPNVRFTPESGHWLSQLRCPLCAKSGHSAMRRKTSLFDHLVGAGKPESEISPG